MKKVALFFAFLVASIMLISTVLAGSGFSSTAHIELNWQGAKGKDKPMYDTITVSGDNAAGSATTTLYIASEPTGQGTFKTYACAPGNVLQPQQYSATTGDYHVLLDPSGWWAYNCHGNGKVAN